MGTWTNGASSSVAIVRSGTMGGPESSRAAAAGGAAPRSSCTRMASGARVGAGFPPLHAKEAAMAATATALDRGFLRRKSGTTGSSASKSGSSGANRASM